MAEIDIEDAYVKNHKEMVASGKYHLVDMIEKSLSLPPNQWTKDIISTVFHCKWLIEKPQLEGDNKLTLLDALVWVKLSNSKNAARQSIKAGAVKINGVKCQELRPLLESDVLPIGAIVLENGKRNYEVIYFLDSWAANK